MFKQIVKENFDNFENLNKYVDLIEEKNKVMNLTGFSGDRLWKEGIYESLLCLEKVKDGKLLDIGAGAGFPSVPAIIANENINLTIYEPLQKRVKFLDEVKQQLNLNIDLKVLRAEETQEVEVYDYVTARAVAPLRILIEIAHKPLKIGGTMIFPKGINYEEELKDAEKIMKKLNIEASISEINKNDVKTYIIKLIKKTKTPKDLPRNWAQIKKG